MHTELEMKFKKQLDWAKASDAIKEIIGANTAPASNALKGTSLADIESVVA